MSENRVIAIDHGNRNIKTLNHVFPASYVESSHLPSFGGDTLLYNGQEYTLVDKRMPQKNDKTMDESYYILTLFAIGKELTSDTGSNISKDTVDVILLVGLPPLHCKELSSKFSEYFKGDGKKVSFEFNKTTITIRIEEVHVYPQAYAAALMAGDKVADSRVVNIIDIGGYTIDILQLINFKPDMSVCTSLYEGVNTLFQRINEQIRATGKKNIPDAVIESILLNDSKVLADCSPERVEMVRSHAERFTKELIFGISQAGLDLTENRTIVIGGGAILLKEFIKKSNMISKPVFVDDVHANANGYQLIYDRRKSKQS